MNSSSDSNGRKRRIVSGSSSVKKTSDRPVSTNGPVGKKDAYQGRKIQFQKKTESSQQSSAQNTLFQAASQQNQNQQSTQQTVFTQQSTQGTAARASGSGKLIRILLIVAVIVIGLIFLRSCLCSGCSPVSMLNEGFEAPTGSSSGIDIGSIPGGDTGASSGSTGSDSLWTQLLSNDYDAADSTAATALSASTSYQNADLTVSNQARSRYTKIKGNGKDVVTVMVYICGSDLESDAAA